jgi:hypothetical protein
MTMTVTWNETKHSQTAANITSIENNSNGYHPNANGVKLGIKVYPQYREHLRARGHD